MEAPISDLTTEAIALAHERMYERAIDRLLEALEILKGRSNQMESEEQNIRNGDTPSIAVIDTIAFPYEKTDIAQTPDSSFSFFNRCFIYEDIDNTRDENQPLASAVTIFNTAVVIHASALHNCKSSAFIRALQLYRSLIDALDDIRGHQQDPGILHLSLACVNNMGHIYSVFMDRSSVLYCSRFLRYNLQFYRTEHADPDDADFFASTIVSLHYLDYLSTSPAA